MIQNILKNKDYFLMRVAPYIPPSSGYTWYISSMFSRNVGNDLTNYTASHRFENVISRILNRLDAFPTGCPANMKY
jgi:hypothetical protein